MYKQTANTRVLVSILVAAALVFSIASFGLTAGAQTYDDDSSNSATSTSESNNRSSSWYSTSSPSTTTPSGSVLYEAEMSGSEEVPPVSTNMSGTAWFWAATSTSSSYSTSTGTTTSSTSSLRYQIDVENGDNIIAAHIHCGVRGVNGPVLVTLYSTSQSGGVDVDGTLVSGTIEASEIMQNVNTSTTTGTGTTTATSTISGCENYGTTTPSLTLIQNMMSDMDAERLYVNVHTTEYPNGEIRGQILRATSTNSGGGTSTSTPATTTDAVLAAQLRAIVNQLIEIQSHLMNLLSKF